jgi:ABC-type lipoprotein release transport system permease subunit
MWRMMLEEVRHRRGRSLALLAGIAAATAAFAVFTANADTQQLVVRGEVSRNFRGAYDILVRPRGVETTIERSEGLVRDNYLSGIFGGITLAQYHEIARLPGVQVAAPIAMIGYVLQPASIEFNLSHDLNASARQLFAVKVVRATDRGLVHITDQQGYVYATRSALTLPTATPAFSSDIEDLPSGRTALVCPETTRADGKTQTPFGQTERGIAFCWSRKTGFYGVGWAGGTFGAPKPGLGFFIRFPFPFLLAAIDPGPEARLDGVSKAIVSGRYLRAADRPTLHQVADVSGGRIDVPVLVSTQPYIDDQDVVTVRALPATAAGAMLHDRTLAQVSRTIARAGPGTVVLRRSIGVPEAYHALLEAINHQQVAVVQNYWSSGATRYRRLGLRTLAPIPVTNPLSVWRSQYMSTGVVDAPIDAEMKAFRPLHPHLGAGDRSVTVQLASLRSVGSFDPTKLPGFSPLSRLPLETYNPPVAAPADVRTRRLLHGRDLLPDGNPAGYLQSPPLLLTDLNSISAFTNVAAYSSVNGRAPISTIRVRVAGVRGNDPLSRERIRVVAQSIEQKTDLQVDVTAGSSPTPVRIDLSAGSHAPTLALTEGWVEKGVAEKIVSALDRQSVVLFVLILVVCAIFVYNATAAGVQSRRVHLGVLASLGWRGRDLFRLIVGEQAIIGTAAGVIGAVVAIPTSSAAGFHVSSAHALLAIPAAVLLAVIAALFPAVQAARMAPVAALRPPVLGAAHGWNIHGLPQFAIVNIARSPTRSLLAATSLALGVAALTVLVAITTVFHNTLTGSLLGSAITLQVRTSEYAAVAVIIVLATAGIADILYLGLRERDAELATLRAGGWTNAVVARLVVAEALWLGLAGSLAGAGIGLLAAATFAASLPHQLILIAIIAAAAGTAVAALAALAPTIAMSRLPIVPILAAE